MASQASDNRATARNMFPKARKIISPGSQDLAGMLESGGLRACGLRDCGTADCGTAGLRDCGTAGLRDCEKWNTRSHGVEMEHAKRMADMPTHQWPESPA